MRFLTMLLLPLVLLSTAAAEEGDMSLRSFDVSLITAPRYHRLGPVLGATGSTESPSVWIGTEDGEVPEPRAFLDGDMLVELISMTVERASWDMDGASIEFRAGRLLVRNRVHVLDKVQALLGDVEKAASRRVIFHVEVFSLAPQAYRGLDGPPTADQLKGADLLESGSVETWPGVRASFKVTNRVRILKEFDVEIAESASIADPIVETAEEGLAVDLIPHPTSAGDRILVEALVQHGTFDQPMRRFTPGDLPHKYLGMMDLPVFRQVSSYSSAMVRAGGALHIPFVSEGRLLLVRIRTELKGGATSGTLLDMGATCRRPREYLVGQDFEDADHEQIGLTVPRIRPSDEPEPPLAEIEELRELLVQYEDPWYWDEDGEVGVAGESLLIVRADPEVLARVKRFLGAREAEVLRTVTVDARVLSVETTGPIGEAAAFAPPAGARTRQAGTITTLPGRGAFLMAGNVANFLGDYTVEVAQSAQISDPIVGQSFEGFLMNVRPHLSMDRRRVRLDLNLVLARRSAVADPIEHQALNVGKLDPISERRTVFNQSVELAAGGTYTIDAGPDLSDPKRRLIVVVRARVD